jgi:leucyl/phenylalanyl-tRNA--protein transferase
VPVFALPDEFIFPDPRLAEDSGLIALGGDLQLERVLLAYQHGIFPWPIEGAPLAWFSPDPRMLLMPGAERVTRSLRQRMRRGLRVTADRCFGDVIEACATVPRGPNEGTWITEDLKTSWRRLHAIGLAHSVEVWDGDNLVGGLYGLELGAMFCGESMFHRTTDASKVAFVALARVAWSRGHHFVDCQLHTPHLERLGARTVPRDRFLEQLHPAVAAEIRVGPWSLDIDAGVLVDPDATIM